MRVFSLIDAEMSARASESGGGEVARRLGRGKMKDDQRIPVAREMHERETNPSRESKGKKTCEEMRDTQRKRWREESGVVFSRRKIFCRKRRMATAHERERER